MWVIACVCVVLLLIVGIPMAAEYCASLEPWWRKKNEGVESDY